MKERTKELDKLKGRPILLVCQTGTRSAQIYGELTALGFTEVAGLAGGMGAWQQSNMPVEKDG